MAAVEAEEAAGTVLATSPPAGTPMAYGARVDLLVAGERSGERVVVPRLVGLKREDALFLLNAAGLLPQVEEVPSGAPEGLVLAQVPGPGEAVLPGSPVRLRVAVQGAVQLPEAFPGTPSAPWFWPWTCPPRPRAGRCASSSWTPGEPRWSTRGRGRRA